MKLNQKIADTQQLPSGKASVTYRDSDVAGLGYRVQGRKCTWVVRISLQGNDASVNSR